MTVVTDPCNPGTEDPKERLMSVQTIPELFLTAVRDFPRPDCFSYRDESGQYVDVSSEEALRRVKALRMGLKSLGIQPGDRVALLSENRIELALLDLACLPIPDNMDQLSLIAEERRKYVYGEHGEGAAAMRMIRRESRSPENCFLVRLFTSMMSMPQSRVQMPSC